MSKSNRLSRKEHFGLLWRYLKECVDYEDFCEWAAKKEWQAKEKNNLRPLRQMDISDFPAKFRCSQEGKFHPFFDIYSMVLFGDIRSRTFEYFERQWNSIQEIEKSLPPVEYSNETLEEYFSDILQNFWDEYKREPSLREFTDELKKVMRFSSGRIHLTVKVRNQNIEMLKKEINRFLMHEINNGLKTEWRRDGVWLYPAETGTRVRGQLERYLRVYVYREKEKKDWEEILKKEYPDIGEGLSDKTTLPYEEKWKLLEKRDAKLRSLVKDLQRAKTIMENLKQGIFPGEY